MSERGGKRKGKKRGLMHGEMWTTTTTTINTLHRPALQKVFTDLGDRQTDLLVHLLLAENTVRGRQEGKE